MDETNRLSEEEEKLVDKIDSDLESHFFVLNDLKWQKSLLNEGRGVFREEKRKRRGEKDRRSTSEEEKRLSEDIELKLVDRRLTSEEKKRLSKRVKILESEDLSEWWYEKFKSHNPMFYEKVIQRFHVDDQREIIIKGLLSVFEVKNKSFKKDYDEVFRYLNNYWIGEHSNESLLNTQKEEKPAAITNTHQQIGVLQSADLNNSNDEKPKVPTSEAILKYAKEVGLKAGKNLIRSNRITKLKILLDQKGFKTTEKYINKILSTNGFNGQRQLK